MDSAMQTCTTCYGEGVFASDRSPCVDCAGLGKLPSGLVLTERRLRTLEEAYQRQGGETAADMQWLVAQVRRSQHTLLQILAAAQDVEADAIATKIKFLANDLLRVYPPQKQ